MWLSVSTISLIGLVPNGEAPHIPLPYSSLSGHFPTLAWAYLLQSWPSSSIILLLLGIIKLFFSTFGPIGDFGFDFYFLFVFLKSFG